MDDGEWDCWMASLTQEFEQARELVIDSEAWCTAVHGIAKSWTWLSYWTESSYASISVFCYLCWFLFIGACVFSCLVIFYLVEHLKLKEKSEVPDDINFSWISLGHLLNYKNFWSIYKICDFKLMRFHCVVEKFMCISTFIYLFVSLKALNWGS